MSKVSKTKVIPEVVIVPEVVVEAKKVSKKQVVPSPQVEEVKVPTKATKKVKAEPEPEIKVVEVLAVVEEHMVQPKKTRTKKVVEVAEVKVTEVDVDVDGDVKKPRRQVNREEVEKSFDDIADSIDLEIETLRSVEEKKSIKFLRSLTKTIRQLKVDFLRVSSKSEKKVKSVRSSNSGFMKPVKISSDMQKFTGVSHDQLVSRVDVTKSICNYVKEHDLQNPADRREFTPDAKLAALLGSNESTTYYNLQKKIQPHFVK